MQYHSKTVSILTPICISIAVYTIVFLLMHISVYETPPSHHDKDISILGKKGTVIATKKDISITAEKRSSRLSLHGDIEISNFSYKYARKGLHLYTGDCKSITYSEKFPFGSFRNITYINKSNDSQVSIDRCIGLPKHIFSL